MKKISLKGFVPFRILLFVLFVFLVPVFSTYSLSLEQFLTSYFNVLIQDEDIPDSYRYIHLKYKNIPATTKLYKTLQKAVYFDIFPNANIELPLNQEITQKQAISIISQGLNVDIKWDNTPATLDWLTNVLLTIQNDQTSSSDQSSLEDNVIIKNPLFQDVYEKLHQGYLSSSWIDEKDLLYGSIKGMVEWLADPYTSFFPPVAATSFNDQMEGEYYGIWAYVEMTTPGVLIIIAPIKNTPAEKIGLLGWDRVVQIDDKIVTEDMSLETAVSYIKWPVGTTVYLKILRDGKILDKIVPRKKIVINNIETNVFKNNQGNVCYVSISMFDFGVAKNFQRSMNALSQKNCVKYIFDVRNNPWWSLEEVIRMLNYIVPTWEPSVIVRSKYITEKSPALNLATGSKITDESIRVLINQWSASASEIFAGVIKDYAPKSLLIGQKTFGKWSVQDLITYSDGSMLKYTIAKWYMWKSDKNIDKIGISPDIKITDDKETSEDEILQRAIYH